LLLAFEIRPFAGGSQELYGNPMNALGQIVRRWALNWHPVQMAKEIDPLRAKGAVAVVKQHPGMVLFAAAPGIVALGVVWWLFGSGWAALLFIALVLGGGAALLLKR
jgi:hypothetical protein